MSAVTAGAAADVQSGPKPLWRRFLNFWFAIEPIRHAWWETLVMRGIIAWAAWLTLRQPSPFDQQPQPHGLAAWGVDFTWLGSTALSPSFVPLWAVCLILYLLHDVPMSRLLLAATDRTRSRSSSTDELLGVLRGLYWVLFAVAVAVECLLCLLPPVVSLLPVLVASVGLGVLGNSQGAIGHTTQVLTVVLLAQWLAYLWAAIQPRTSLPMPRGYDRQQLAADWGRQSLAATYVVSAVTKLIESRGDWFSDTPYFGLQVVKSEGMGYYDWLMPRISGGTAWLGQWMVDHPMATAVILAGALPLELLAFLGLNNRRSALFFGCALLLFHSTVTEVMQLGFLYHKLLLLALFINPAWWLVAGARRLFARP